MRVTLALRSTRSFAYGANLTVDRALGNFAYLSNYNINGTVYFINTNNVINLYVDRNNAYIISHKK